MGIITNIYKKNFLRRFDKDPAIPYYDAGDFPGLDRRDGSFENKAGVTVKYFVYSREGYDPERLILFCPGMGPGHTAYLSEIETLCRAGLKVLTLDYTGCGESGGEKLPSVNAPVRDASELLDLLCPKEEIIPVGHSLGGYTALTLAHVRPEVGRAVVLSGFIGISDEMMGYLKLRFLSDMVSEYEKKLDPELGSADNREYLSKTSDRILWIHSKDDPTVNYRYNAGQVEKLNNPNVRVITVRNKKHNPQYTEEAVATMNAWLGEYARLTAKKKLSSPEDRKAFFESRPISRMTEQDPAVYDLILGFIREPKDGTEAGRFPEDEK